MKDQYPGESAMEKLTPEDYLRNLCGFIKNLDCAGRECCKCPLGLLERTKYPYCLAVLLADVLSEIPEKCPTCGAVKNG